MLSSCKIGWDLTNCIDALITFTHLINFIHYHVLTDPFKYVLANCVVFHLKVTRCGQNMLWIKNEKRYVFISCLWDGCYITYRNTQTGCSPIKLVSLICGNARKVQHIISDEPSSFSGAKEGMTAEWRCPTSLNLSTTIRWREWKLWRFSFHLNKNTF